MHQAFCATIPLLSSSIYCQSPTLVSYCSSKLSLRVPFSSAASSAEHTPRWFGCPILPCYSGCIFLFLLAESYYAKDTRFGTSISDCSHCAFDCLICLCISNFTMTHGHADFTWWYLACVGCDPYPSFGKNQFYRGVFGIWYAMLIPAIHASIWPTACRQPMALHFIIFSSFNAIGGLDYVLRVPERLGGNRSRFISCFLMHISITVAAIFLSEKLFAAKASDTTFFADECRGLTWWCQLCLMTPPFYLEHEITSKPWLSGNTSQGLTTNTQWKLGFGSCWSLLPP